MNCITRRTCGLIAAVCLLGAAVPAATAPAALLTPHAAAPQVIAPEAAPGQSTLDPAAPAVEEPAGGEAAPASAPFALPDAQLQPRTEARSRNRLPAAPPVMPEGGERHSPVEFGERFLGRLQCPFFFPLVQAAAEEAALLARQAAEAISALDGSDPQPATQVYIATLESFMARQGFVRTCFTTRIP